MANKADTRKSGRKKGRKKRKTHRGGVMTSMRGGMNRGARAVGGDWSAWVSVALLSALLVFLAWQLFG